MPALAGVNKQIDWQQSIFFLTDLFARFPRKKRRRASRAWYGGGSDYLITDGGREENGD